MYTYTYTHIQRLHNNNGTTLTAGRLDHYQAGVVGQVHDTGQNREQDEELCEDVAGEPGTQDECCYEEVEDEDVTLKWLLWWRFVAMFWGVKLDCTNTITPNTMNTRPSRQRMGRGP